MTTALHAELTADRQRIALIAAGPVESLRYAAKQLEQLTPLFSPSEPKGGLMLPASWPGVVQLAGLAGPSWRPGPALQAWIAEQAAARTNGLSEPLTAPLPDNGMTPWPHQVDGAQVIASTGRALLFDEPRCLAGDTELSINRAGKGSAMKIRNLVARFTGQGPRAGAQWRADIPTYVQREVDGIVRLGLLKDAWCSGTRTTYTVTTDTGRTIRASAEHPFMTVDGWCRLDELEIGTLVHVRGAQATGQIKQPRRHYIHVAGLPAHPWSHGAGRRTSKHRVGLHRLVVEAHRNGFTTDDFIALIRSGNVGNVEFLSTLDWAVHHIDRDPLNNELTNLQVLTHAEHHALHANEGKVNNVLYKIVTERVASIELFGDELTYDIEVADDPHNFIANGFVVHNTGKTITTILGLVERQHRGLLTGPILVICPAAVVDPWLEAAEDWAPHWKAVAWNVAKRKQITDADLYVCSYAMARKDARDTNPKHSPLIALNATALVVDECHEIKSQASQQSHAVRRAARNVKAFVALSGTPITHHPGDLWPTLVALAPGAWPARERFVARYCATAVVDYGEGILGLNPGTEPEFRVAILGQHRRVARADLGWAPKSYEVRSIALPEEYRKPYDDLEASMLAMMPDGQEVSVMDVLSQMTVLSTMASAAADVEVTWETDEETGLEKRHLHLELKEPSWVVDELIRILNARDREPTVAFAVSKQLALIAGRAAERAGLRVGYIIGGQTRTKRSATRKAFQAGQLDLICATVGAGGVGITLNAAKTLVFLQRPWSIVQSIQAEDRGVGDINAPGCHVIDIVVTGTVYARVRAVLRERAGQLSDLLQDPRIRTELLGGASIHQLRKAS